MGKSPVGKSAVTTNTHIYIYTYTYRYTGAQVYRCISTHADLHMQIYTCRSTHADLHIFMLRSDFEVINKWHSN